MRWNLKLRRSVNALYNKVKLTRKVLIDTFFGGGGGVSSN